MPDFITICQNYNADVKMIIKDVFKNKYYLNEPLVWQFKDSQNERFLAEYLKSIGVKNDIKIYLENDQLVIIIIYY